MAEPTEITEDTGIYPTLILLAECAQAEMAKSGMPIEIVTIQPGIDAVLDHVGNGKECAEIIINMPTAFPSGVNFPSPDDSGQCATELAYQVQVAAFRCAPVPTGKAPNLKLPTPADQLNATRQHLADMAALHRAIRCCLAGTKGQERRYVLGPWTPYGPQGVSVGGWWTVTIGGKEDDD